MFCQQLIITFFICLGLFSPASIKHLNYHHIQNAPLSQFVPLSVLSSMKTGPN